MESSHKPVDGSGTLIALLSIICKSVDEPFVNYNYNLLLIFSLPSPPQYILMPIFFHWSSES